MGPVVVFAIAFWLGAYLLSRPNGKWALRLAGLGLLAYAAAIALNAHGRMALSIAAVGVSELLWLSAVVIELRRQRMQTGRRPIRLLLIAAIFFVLSTAALILPFDLLPQSLLLFAIGVDVALLGLAIARLDAFDEGELLWRDLARSLIGAALASLMFGGLMASADGPGLLLFLAVAAAIASQTFADPLQALIDRVAFARQPELTHAREELREVAAALPRMPDVFDPNAIDEVEFARLTRRALSHYGDLTKLTSSPLTQMSVIGTRLAGAQPDTPLARAAALKALLSECIAALKPAGASGFGMADEWRHFNALYYPYVLGLKPYSERVDHSAESAEAKAARDWFRAAVPERTLHNWQNAAARLIAQQLRAYDARGPAQ
jgi:hypothetical protein